MRLDFDYTCPVIDKGIESVKEVLYLEIKEFLEELNGKTLTPKEVFNQAKSFEHRLYSEIEYIFEDVRKVNEDMRLAAHSQLDDMEDKNTDLKREIERLERSIEDLESEIKDLEKRPVWA